jgi:hypothetical protein
VQLSYVGCFLGLSVASASPPILPPPRPRASLHTCAVSFDIYNVSGDGFITREELFAMMEATLAENDVSLSPVQIMYVDGRCPHHLVFPAADCVSGTGRDTPAGGLKGGGGVWGGGEGPDVLKPGCAFSHPRCCPNCRNLVDATFREADLNGDGKIDYSEFETMVAKQPSIIKPLSLNVSELLAGHVAPPEPEGKE